MTRTINYNKVLGVACIIMLVGVSWIAGHSSVACDACEVCPNIYFSYESTNVTHDKTWVYLSYEDVVFTFWGNNDYVSLTYNDYKDLYGGIEARMDLRYNSTIFTIADINCVLNKEEALVEIGSGPNCYLDLMGNINSSREW